jgi:cholesterol transport system auxiliary component
MIRLIRPAIAAAALTLSLGGCFGGAKLPDTLFSLTPTAAPAAGSGASGTMAEALMVLEPEVDRKLSITRVPVQVDDSNVAYLKDAAWVERPARQFRNLLAETLRARGNRLIVDEQGGTGLIGQRLGGRLIDMGYDAPSQSVVVRFEAVRSSTGGTVSTRRFEAIEPGVTADPVAVGPALNRAANKVAADVAAWIG